MIARDVVRVVVQLTVSFAIGTGAGAAICLYYGIPLIFSLLGGIAVLALLLFVRMATPFDGLFG